MPEQTTGQRLRPLICYEDLFGEDIVQSAVGADAAHVAIEGLVLQHQDYIFEVASGAHHLAVRRCELLGGRYEVVVRDGAHHLEFEDLTVDGRFPPWVPRNDVKMPSGDAP